MSNVLAGIGIGQMEVLEERVAARRANFEYYVENLSHISEISFAKESAESFSNRWLTCILTPSFQIREKIRTALEKENIESRPLWKPMHMQPVFEKSPSYVNGISEDLFEKGLCLPSGSSMEEGDLERICDIIKSVLR
jgi:dTDP-4-amino-4,6-dideoxygalactose transaminase